MQCSVFCVLYFRIACIITSRHHLPNRRIASESAPEESASPENTASPEHCTRPVRPRACSAENRSNTTDGYVTMNSLQNGHVPNKVSVSCFHRINRVKNIAVDIYNMILFSSSITGSTSILLLNIGGILL